MKSAPTGVRPAVPVERDAAMRDSDSMKIRQGTPNDHATLVDIWVRSVRATHVFLSEVDIQFYLPLVRDHALKELELWVLANDDESLMGFMGLSENKLEALFLAPEFLRRGGGRLLVEHARQLKGPLLVDVNEQNPQAVSFYESLGFTMTSRSELDSSGRPFPIIHMQDSGRAL